MRRQIVYLMSWPAHLPYLVCSLWTLRRWWDGEVVVHAWSESSDLVRRIFEDKRLPISDVRLGRVPVYRQKNAQFLDKIRLMQSLDGEADAALYLDADTTVHGDLSPLFDVAAEYGFAATQFNTWLTQQGIPRKRIIRLRDFPAIDQEMVERTLTEPWPSVNGGVFAVRPRSPVLPVWHRWTLVAKGIFIADETVLHVLQPKFYPQELATVTANGRYNCSPKFQRTDRLPDREVVVYHYHGDCNTRPDKSPKGHALWWTIYQECLRENVGGMAEWHGTVDNKYLNRLERIA